MQLSIAGSINQISQGQLGNTQEGGKGGGRERESTRVEGGRVLKRGG